MNPHNEAHNEAQNVKILLVDDSEVMLGHVASLLRRAGFTVQTASSMPVALDLFFKHQSEALLIDFILEGGRTGLEVATAVFALCQAGAVKKPHGAILTQGALAPVDQQKAAELGLPVLQKPVFGKEDEFLMSITLWLRKCGLLTSERT